jgi:crossover junction endonuclease MUS81
MINFIVDTREKELINILTSKNIDFKIEQLDLGDIVFKTDTEDALIIERKTVQDLKASICDGRWKEQKMRLLNCGIEKRRIMYLIEGDISKTYNISSNSIIGSLINSMLRDNLKIYKTFNIQETVDFIIRLNDKLKKDMNLFFKDSSQTTSKDYSAVLSKVKKDNLTPTVFYIHILSSIPRVSENISTIIQTEYISLDLLIEAFKISGQYLLENLQYNIKNNKKRRIGKEISKRIYNFLLNK